MATRPPAAGLASAEAAALLRANGPNLLPQDAPRRWPRLLGGVLSEPMLLLLLAAAVVYLLLGDPQEALALLASVVAVIGLALYQAVRAEHALQALRDLGSPRARVLRDGTARVVAGAEVVVGDLLLLEEGDRVAADARVLSAQDLRLDESLLTGESVPVEREPDAMVRASTLVVGGRGRAVVTATGAATAVGGIHATMRGIRRKPSPMQREVRQAVVVFAALGILASALVVLLHVRAHGDWLQALLAGLTLAIANIPEEFPVVLAVFLALGAWRMARQRALVRQPPAIETLGAITVLCTDKTGTLTENRMAVAELAAPGARGAPAPILPDTLRELLDRADRASPFHAFDPMEVAIRNAAALAGIAPPDDAQRIREYPFSPTLPVSATLWRADHGEALVAAAKGAPETMLRLCGGAGDERATILAEVERMAARGLRVIAIADAAWAGDAGAAPADAGGFAWRWRGLVALHDPLRTGVPEAVRRARAAGIRVLMLTGDHPATAAAIAEEAGIAMAGGVMPADALDALDDDAFLACVARHQVYARMQPPQKLRLVNALRAAGEIVAMTGDGVNDAPSLLAADAGIAMGARGTDVAREAASIVLLDDNFVTVVDAIAAGRTIYDNIRRAVGYILAVHVPITGLALLPLLLGTPLVLLPMHVVFLELIIDPASSLVFERDPPDPAAMRRPPRPRRARLIDAAVLGRGLAGGAIAFLAVFAAHAAARRAGLAHAEVAAAAFIALVSGNLALLRHGRARREPGAALPANRAFALIVAVAMGMLALTVTVPPVARWFHFAAPPAWIALPALALPWGLLGGAAAVARACRPRR